MNIIFFGTGDFAAIILNKILQTTSYKLQAIITQPDQPAGRKKTLTPSPVKVLAEKNKLPVLQPAKLNTQFIKKLKAAPADLFIIADYGKIIPPSIINLPSYQTINVHPSLLPYYRGPSPIQTALLNGDKATGVSIILVDEKIDHGPIIAQKKIALNQSVAYPLLLQKLAQLGADLLIEILNKALAFSPNKYSQIHSPLFANSFVCAPQNHTQATFTKIIKKQDGLITPDKTAAQILNMSRAYQPWPGVFIESRIKNKELRMRLIKIELTNLINKKNNPLELFVENNSLYLSCANCTVLKINSLQLNGKNPVDAPSFINGYMK